VQYITLDSVGCFLRRCHCTPCFPRPLFLLYTYILSWKNPVHKTGHASLLMYLQYFSIRNHWKFWNKYQGFRRVLRKRENDENNTAPEMLYEVFHILWRMRVEARKALSVIYGEFLFYWGFGVIKINNHIFRPFSSRFSVVYDVIIFFLARIGRATVTENWFVW